MIAGCAEFLWPVSRGGALHGPRGSTGNLLARRRREGQGVGGAKFVATASDQSNDAHAQDSEVGQQLCRPGDDDVGRLVH